MQMEYKTCGENQRMPSRADSRDIMSKNDKFICNLIMDDGMCLDNKLKKKARIKIEWKKHLERIKKLSEPKRMFYYYEEAKESGVPLEKILPRLIKLARPKYFTPKFVRPPEECFPLPGKIQDWEGHKRWLELRAQPKKLPRPKITLFRDPVTKISELRLMQICEKLSRPRKKIKKSHHRCRQHDRFSLYDPVSERISELSQPRRRHTCACIPCNSTSSQSSSVSLEVSERIKLLATPKYHHNIKCNKKKSNRLKRPSPSHDNLIMKDCNLRLSMRTA